MNAPRNSERGYSLTELLTVVAILGVVVLVAIPAMLQLMPQYRIRSGATEMASTVRLARQKAVTQRLSWRVCFDPAGERYKMQMLPANSATWTDMTTDGMRPITGLQSPWKRLSAIDLRTNTTNPFPTVGSFTALTFLRNGEVDTSTGITFSPDKPSVVLAVSNNFVRYNRYYIYADAGGGITVVAAKE